MTPLLGYFLQLSLAPGGEKVGAEDAEVAGKKAENPGEEAKVCDDVGGKESVVVAGGHRDKVQQPRHTPFFALTQAHFGHSIPS